MRRLTNAAISRIMRFLQWLRIGFYAGISNGTCKGRSRKIQPVLILGDGIVEFGKNVTLGYFPSPFYFSGCIHLEARNKSSSITFGDDTHVNNNFVAIAEHTAISIGKRCFIGTNVEIVDSDFHGIKVSDRGTSNPEMARRVAIGDDVFIGSNVKIMKGAAIGDGAVVANGSVVIGAVPPNTIFGGNPARAIKAIEQ